MWSTRRPRGRVLVGHPDPQPPTLNCRSSYDVHSAFVAAEARGAVPSRLPDPTSGRRCRAVSVLLLLPDDLRVSRFASPFSPSFFLRASAAGAPLSLRLLLSDHPAPPRRRRVSGSPRLDAVLPFLLPFLDLSRRCATVRSARYKLPIIGFGLPDHPEGVPPPRLVGPTLAACRLQCPLWPS